MELREFIFREMHGKCPDPLRDLRKSEIKNDPESRELVARFLHDEIYYGELQATMPQSIFDTSYDIRRDEYLKLAEEFITEIIPSDTFMIDAIMFFGRIREGKI